MKFSRMIFLTAALAMIAMLVGCGSSSSSSSTPPPPPPTVAITATSGSSQSATTNAAFQNPLVATVTTGGTPTSGVTVTFAAPGSGASGSFAGGVTTATTNSSGVATSPAFTANSQIGSYMVTASVSGASTPASFSLTNTVPPGPALADGTYVFSVTGEATTAQGSSPYYFLAGTFTVSGGTITGGEQDYVDSFIYGTQDAITSGTVTATADGNLLIVLNVPGDTNVGVNGVETFDITAFSTTRARIIAFDNDTTASGRMDVQSSTAAPSAGYAFFTGGEDGSGNPVAIGGVINIDTPGTISGTGSIFDANDNGSGTTYLNQTFSTSTVSAPDAFGRVLFTLNPTANFPQINLAGYIVDTSHIRLVEQEPSSSTFNGTMGGIAIGQGTNTGALTSVSGNSYVAGLAGLDPTGVLLSAGVITTNVGGTISGAINYNDLGKTVPMTPSTITGGTYTVDPSGIGRVTMTSVTDGNVMLNLQAYLTGSGSEAEITIISMDTGDIQAGYGFLQSNAGSFTAASLSGTYVLDATGFSPASGEPELDAVGQIIADGVGTLIGTVDLNYFGVSQTAPVTASGTFAANANGAFTGAITGLDVTTSTNADTFVYYLIDATKAFAIETDTNQLTLGFLTLEQ